MSDSRPDPATTPGRTSQDIPAANQARTEPMPPSSAPSDSSVSDPDTSGEMPVDPPHGLADPTGRTAPPDTLTGDSAGLSATGNARPAVAQAGKPDGEVDTRT